MGIRFRKSIKAGPARVNFSKTGMGFSVGTKGYRVTKMANGRTRKTSSIPGTGISYVTETSNSKESKKEAKTTVDNSNNNSSNKNSNPNNKQRYPKNNEPMKKKLLYILLFIIFPPALIYYAWKKKHWTFFAKALCTIALSFYSICLVSVIIPTDEKDNKSPVVENENSQENQPEETPKEDIEEEPSNENSQEPIVTEPVPVPTPTPPVDDTPAQEPVQKKVWVGESGTKYHSRSNCSNMKNARQITLDEAEAQGYSPCKKCY